MRSVHTGAGDPVATRDPDSLVLQLPEERLQERFEALQRKLASQWELIEEFTDEPYGIVVVPSLSGVDLPLDSTKRQAYEERYLFLMFLLRQPGAELVYVTSEPIQPSIVDYYMGLLPGVDASDARRRLHLVSPHDGGPTPLSAKLLERPRLIETIRSLAGDPDRAHLVPFTTTRLERDLALSLGIPMYGADPRFAVLGTKSGARALFAEAGVPYPEGCEDVRSVDDVVDAVLELVSSKPDLERVVLKHDEGVSGLGNSLLDVRGLAGANRARVVERLRELRPEDPHTGAEEFLERLADGGIVEELIVGDEIRSPSVQMRATPLGVVEQLSTHDQLLGGESGHLFLGSVFPASSEYAREISVKAMKVGQALAARGVLGRFAIDFLTVRTDRGWRSYAIELNLRKGGTTHPYLTLQFLTGGEYDVESALFLTPEGKAKFFVSTDRLASDGYRVLQPEDVFELAARERLNFDHASQTGVVFHMLTTLGRHGFIGATAVGDSQEDARSRFDETRSALDREARNASRRR
jgi:PGM1 C-terminal domain/Pre ATP-grasp domain